MFVYMSVILFYTLGELSPLTQMQGGMGFRRRKRRRMTLRKRIQIVSKMNES